MIIDLIMEVSGALRTLTNPPSLALQPILAKELTSLTIYRLEQGEDFRLFVRHGRDYQTCPRRVHRKLLRKD